MKIPTLFKRRPRFQCIEVVNDSDKTTAVACEPWGHEQGLVPGSKVTIKYEVDQINDAIETISVSTDYIQIWFRTNANPQFVAHGCAQRAPTRRTA